MRVGFPVIFIRNGVEFAGIVATSSPRKDQIPDDPSSTLTRDQRFNELRCAIAFWDTDIRGWRQADNVCYLAIDLPIPAEGDFYSEVGAPDAGERIELRQAQAEHAAKMEEGRRAFEALSPEEQARFRAENQVQRQSDMRESGLAAPDVRSPDPLDRDLVVLEGEGGNPLETRPIG